MINALMFVEKLEETGFTSEQAKTSVSTWLELMNDNLVTKDEWKKESTALRHEMKEGFSAVRLEMKEMEKRLIIMFGVIIGGSATLCATIIGIFIIVGKYF
jgi:hypothetical protein